MEETCFQVNMPRLSQNSIFYPWRQISISLHCSILVIFLRLKSVTNLKQQKGSLLCLKWSPSGQSLKRRNWIENNALWNVPRSVPIWLISYYLRQILCPSWQAGSSLFKPLDWGSKITLAGTVIHVWMIPTQWLGDISDYNKLL